MASYIYLFEVKSIQSYLTRTGKLSDLISTSNRLDKFINEDKDSILSLAINVIKNKYPNHQINFIRRRGGSFYSYCDNKEAIQSFRELWLLIFYQYFPYMQHTDYFGEISSPEYKKEDFDKAFKLLNSSINTVHLSMPYATTVVGSTANTGRAVVAYDSKSKQSPTVDLATFQIRNQHENISFSIYSKFIDEDKTIIDDFIKNFDKLYNSDDVEDHDIAYLHFDGNAIGEKLIKLREKASFKTIEEYRKIIKNFSSILGDSTQEAAKLAFQEVYKKNKKQIFYFRPLVLGGDDLTVMIEPKYAFDFVMEYTKQFNKLTKEKFNDIQCSYPFLELDQGLTASGGILFNKIKHPAANTGNLVESLASKAKALTKNIDKLPELNDFKGRSAVAFYRMSTSSQESFENIFSRGRMFNCYYQDDTCSCHEFNLGSGVYFIESVQYPNVNDFIKFLDILQRYNSKDSEKYISVIPAFRKMMSKISLNNFSEAEQIYSRLTSRLRKNSTVLEEMKYLFNLMNPGTNRFYYKRRNKEGMYLESPLADLLLIHHYMYDESERIEQGEQDETN